MSAGLFRDEPEIQVPDVAEPIRAYRSWSADGFVLSGTFGADWEPGGTLTATCRAGATCGCDYCTMLARNLKPHACPSPTSEGHGGHGCGIYGYLTPELLAAHGPAATKPDGGHDAAMQAALVWMWAGGTPAVWGEVEMWGRVMVHEGGYRAEHARIVRLFDLSDVARRAAHVYGVPCDPFPLTADQIKTRRDEAQRSAYTAGLATIFGPGAFATFGSWANARQSSPQASQASATYAALMADTAKVAATLGLTTASNPPVPLTGDVKSWEATTVNRWAQAEADKDRNRAKFRFKFLGGH